MSNTASSDREPDQEILSPLEILGMADQADKLTGNIPALVAWLLSFPPDEAMEQLRFVYRRCRSIARSTTIIESLDRLVRERESKPWEFLPDDDTYLLVELIEWHLDRMRKGRTSQHLVPRFRELLASLAYAAEPVEGVTKGETPATIYDPLLRLAEQATIQVGEMASLVSWLLQFAPESDIRELEAMKQVTGSYQTALSAIQGVDALLVNEWQSPREYVTGDLSMVLLFIDYRIRKKQGKNLERLEGIRQRLLTAQRDEILTAARRLAIDEETVLAEDDLQEEIECVDDSDNGNGSTFH